MIFQRFRKGVGGQRGLARGDPSCARDSDLFSVPFFLGEGEHNSGDQLLLCLGPVGHQPPPANPFRNLWQFQEKTLSEWKGHSWSSRRVLGYSRSSSRNTKFHSRSTKFHDLRNMKTIILGATPGVIPRNWWEPTWMPQHSRSVLSRIGTVPAPNSIEG